MPSHSWVNALKSGSYADQSVPSYQARGQAQTTVIAGRFCTHIPDRSHRPDLPDRRGPEAPVERPVGTSSEHTPYRDSGQIYHIVEVRKLK
jgi:hypothetical protein